MLCVIHLGQCVIVIQRWLRLMRISTGNPYYNPILGSTVEESSAWKQLIQDGRNITDPRWMNTRNDTADRVFPLAGSTAGGIQRERLCTTQQKQYVTNLHNINTNHQAGFTCTKTHVTSTRRHYTIQANVTCASYSKNPSNNTVYMVSSIPNTNRSTMNIQGCVAVCLSCIQRRHIVNVIQQLSWSTRPSQSI